MLSEYSVRVLLGGVFGVILMLILASPIHQRYHFTKRAFFTVLSGVIVSVTITMLAINLRLIQLSENGSIMSRDGYLTVSACGQQIDILPNRDAFLSSSGDAKHQVFSDGRLRFLGYKTDERLDGSLGGFIESLGGSITSNVLALPLNDIMLSNVSANASLGKFVRTNPIGDKYLELRSGEACDTTPSMLSIFLYEYNPSTHTHVQKRIIRSPEEYQLSDNEFGEPDCIVLAFGDPSERTEYTCNGYPDIKNVTFSGEIE